MMTMKKSYTAPSLKVNTFSVENIVTDSRVLNDQIADLQHKINGGTGGDNTLTAIIKFNEWN